MPGDRPDRFGKAMAAGADEVIIDLEDAVAPGNAEAALTNALSALVPGGDMRAVVRVHSTDSELFEPQLAALLSLSCVTGHGLLGLMVAKAEDPVAIRETRRRLPSGLALIPLVESARGLRAAQGIAALPGVTRLAFGAVDFSLDVGAELDAEILDYARASLVIAARAGGGSAPIDSPSTEITDTDKVLKVATRARRNGFGGMLAIHPAQLGPIAAGFAPSAEEIAWAVEVLDSEGGAAQVRGQLVDRPVTERAKNILLRQASMDAPRVDL
ncbi:CoA ester lyase [Arthrobacter sp. AZCC_0090]|uniref:HpcH/HpaI aldolase/citrate lyase family protein n=1 Tax=Arthrobacter sp. AZCC_0090 TaxID=2735881 RepID=UPI001832A85F|nr:CoA ester lyase [Arthrobacter sp. AZCC_0090]MBB6407199.1 citrate lyase subunit beta/citryl-CoA lyase [Arthrobacter sp. AZCC_0090]